MTGNFPPRGSPERQELLRDLMKRLDEEMPPTTVYRETATYEGRDGRPVTIHACRIEKTPPAPPRKREDE